MLCTVPAARDFTSQLINEPSVLGILELITRGLQTHFWVLEGSLLHTSTIKECCRLT